MTSLCNYNFLSVAVAFFTFIFVTLLPSASLNAQIIPLNRDSLIQAVNNIDDTYSKCSLIDEVFQKGRPDSADTYFISDLLDSISFTSTETEIRKYSVVAKAMKSQVLQYRGQYKESLRIDEEALAILTELLSHQYINDELAINLKEIKTGMHINMGSTYHLVAEQAKGIAHLEQALDLAKELNIVPYIHLVLARIANTFQVIGDDDQAAEYLYEALSIPDSTPSVYFVEIYKGLGLMHQQRNEQAKALEYFEKAVALTDSLEDSRMDIYRIESLANLQLYYIELPDIHKADSLHKKIKALCVKNETDYRLLESTLDLAVAYSEENDYGKAKEYLNEAKDLLIPDSKENYAQYLFTKAKVLNLEGQLEEAKKMVSEALTVYRKLGRKLEISTSYKLLSDIDFKLGNHKIARTNLINHYQLEDTVLNEKVALSQDILSVKYKSEKNKNILNKLESEKLKNLSKIDSQRSLLTASLYGFSLLGILVFSLFRNNRSKQKANKLLQEKNKIIASKSQQNETLIKEIHHRVKNNLQTISSLLYLQSTNITDQDAKEAISQGQRRVESMALIHKNLYQRDNLAGIEMKDYIFRLANNLKDACITNEQEIDININMTETELDVDTAIPLGLIINELLTNVFKYAFPEKNNGKIEISFSKGKYERFRLTIKDNGIGHTKLETGFGSQLIQLLTKQLEATFSDGNDNGYWCRISTME